jgi:signal transduction histidine kinase
MLGEINRSIDYALRTIDFAESHDLFKDNISPLINLGSGYEKRGEYQKAVETWEQGYQIAMEHNQIRNACDSCINLSMGYNALGETTKALEYAEQALSIHKKHFPEQDLGKHLNNIGLIHETAGDLDTALDYYKQAIESFEGGFDQISRANCLINIASIHVKTGHWETALTCLNPAREINAELQIPSLTLKLHGLYAEVYAGLGQHEKAYSHQKQLSEHLHKSLDEKTANSISRMEADYYRKKIEIQAEQYRKQNIELRKRNRTIKGHTRILEKKNSELADTVEMLNWDVSVITHDVRAPLAHISQVLKMIVDGAFPDNEIPSLLQALYDSSSKTYNLIDEILDGIRLQRQRLDSGIDILELDVVPILQSLVSVYKPIALQKNIKLESSFTESVMPAKIDISLIKIVIRNLLNNSIKFTPDYGYVNLSAEYQDGFLVITIKDSGKGLTKTERRNLLKRDSVNLTKNTWIKGIGLGFTLCQQSLKKMNGKITIDSVPGEGTTFRISLPR